MMRELEVKELMSKHRSELRNIEMQLSTMKDNESDLLGRIDMMNKEREELTQQVKENANEESVDKKRENNEEIEKLEKQLREEKLKKDQAINKLAEMMMRKDLQPKPGSKKVSVDELRKKEKEIRRLKHELSTEKEKFNQMVAKNQADLQNLQATLYEESQARLKLSMELDTKESEVENLQLKLTHINLDTESISSGRNEKHLVKNNGSFMDISLPADSSVSSSCKRPLNLPPCSSNQGIGTSNSKISVFKLFPSRKLIQNSKGNFWSE